MKKTKCKRCGYEWTPRTKMFMVTCPNCGRKTERCTMKQYIKDAEKAGHGTNF